MEDERWIPRDERVDLMVQLSVEISQLEEDLYYAENDRLRSLVRAELSRKRVELFRLKAMPDENPAVPRRTGQKNRKTFYVVGLSFLAMFMVTGAMVAAGVTAAIMLINYFTTEPRRPEAAPMSREVVKE